MGRTGSGGGGQGRMRWCSSRRSRAVPQWKPSRPMLPEHPQGMPYGRQEPRGCAEDTPRRGRSRLSLPDGDLRRRPGTERSQVARAVARAHPQRRRATHAQVRGARTAHPDHDSTMRWPPRREVQRIMPSRARSTIDRGHPIIDHPAHANSPPTPHPQFVDQLYCSAGLLPQTLRRRLVPRRRLRIRSSSISCTAPRCPRRPSPGCARQPSSTGAGSGRGSRRP